MCSYINKNTLTKSSRKCHWKEMKTAVVSWFHLVCYISLTLSCPLSFIHIDYSLTALFQGVTERSDWTLVILPTNSCARL